MTNYSLRRISYKQQKTAFSLVELSAVLIIIGIVVMGIAAGSAMLKSAKISNARQMTKGSSVVTGIPDLTLWLETTLKESFGTNAMVDGGAIDEWHDLNKTSTHPYTAFQAVSPLTPTAAERPIYDIDAINGLPGVKFDGIDDAMQIANFKANSHMTMFVMGKFDASAAFIEHGPNINTSDGFMFLGSGPTVSMIKRAPFVASNSPGGNWIGDDPVIAVMRYDGVSISQKLNDDLFTDIANTTIPEVKLTDTLNIGSRNNSSGIAKGSFGEIIFYNRGLNDDEVDAVVEYLRSKWGVF